MHIEKEEPSNEHSNCFIPTPLSSSPPVSLPENNIVIEFDEVFPPGNMMFPLPSITLSIESRGSKVSTIHVNVAGLESLFLALSTDKTVNV